MRILRTRAELAQWRAEQQAAGTAIAFVPTMGNLHAGHMRLVDQARQMTRLSSPRAVLVSIFVNPLQFNDPGDLARYPRTETEDCALLTARGVDAVFLPSLETIYPDATADGTGLQVSVMPGPLAEHWEGAARPGHFAGMITVVAKLFQLVRPAVAVFGEKDFQQLQIVRRLVRDLDFDIEIEPVATARADDGLALSSRNRFLTAAERAIAPRLNGELRRAAERIEGRAAPVAQVLAEGIDALTAAGFVIDYFAYCDVDTLLPRQDDGLDDGQDDGQGQGSGILLAAARLGAVRLLDNCRVG
ncbi:pantoate--beta-alanine ligase [Halothiobacillus diazotrophicus]|uniref:Pantothenate synthetase n=1 Tax=Halothiobacillus diazotrophicus TaxID=1860122 RepID=A0A191ZFS4_9GAMM|nr:pantoate--beta-alanine ligase [Halothiobacillus diazotrophicus]ANJ66731.1 pantoate--beta-alanine ligase [Halothiobacillus diazotrophicus]